MAEPVSTVVLTAFLSVTFVGANQGFPMTPDAAYVCGYDQAAYELTQAGVINVVFVPSTEERFQMTHVHIHGDNASEYNRPRVTPRSLSFNAANLTEQSIYFSVVVQDKLTGAQFECDPQITNIPPD